MMHKQGFPRTAVWAGLIVAFAVTTVRAADLTNPVPAPDRPPAPLEPIPDPHWDWDADRPEFNDFSPSGPNRSFGRPSPERRGARPYPSDRSPMPRSNYDVRPPRGWQPGGYSGRIGSPYFYRPDDFQRSHHAPGFFREDTAFFGPSQFERCCDDTPYGYDSPLTRRRSAFAGGFGLWGNPYDVHFGPGYYRHREHGHYRFPYYSYRSPWYFPGPPTYNRDTNFAW